MHYGGKKLRQNRRRDHGHYQNLIDCSLGLAPPLQKFHQNPFITFLRYFGHRHTDRYEDNVLGGGNYDDDDDDDDDVMTTYLRRVVTSC